MRAFEIIGETVAERGMPVSELARRVGMGKELMRRCLNGERKIAADEFISICGVLDLELSDFGSVGRNETK